MIQIEKENRRYDRTGQFSICRPGGAVQRTVLLVLVVASTLLFTACSKGTDNGSSKATGPDAESAAKTKSMSAATGPSGDAIAGKIVYEKQCHVCHGLKGLGDGPVGIAITPHPADFVHDHKRMKKTDEELFESISEGIQKEVGGEAMNMPAWKGILSETERWDVLAYIRQLAKEGRAKEAATK